MLLNQKCINLKVRSSKVNGFKKKVHFFSALYCAKKKALELKANCEVNKNKEVIQKQRQLEEEQKLYPKTVAPPPVISVTPSAAAPIPIPSTTPMASSSLASPRSPSSFIDIAAKSPGSVSSDQTPLMSASVTSDNGELKVESRVKVVRKPKHPKAKPNQVLLDADTDKK